MAFQSRRSILAAVTLVTTAAIVRAQTPAPTATYNTVSVRRAQASAEGGLIESAPKGGIRAVSTSVTRLVSFAYGVRDIQVAGGPSWMRSARFDVTVTPGQEERDAFSEQSRQRMQAVLRDRFGLVVHQETREVPIYGLVVAGKPKLDAAKNTEGTGSLTANRRQIKAANTTMDALSEALSSLVNTYVKNETGLDAAYDFKLQWDVESSTQLAGRLPQMGELISTGDNSGTSIFAALREQLGLRLQPRREQLPVFVIEKIAKPKTD